MSRKAYDIMSIVMLVFFIGSAWYVSHVTSEITTEMMEDFQENGYDSSVIESDSRVVVANYVYLFAKILAVIYWIFVVVLAVNLHKAKKVSMGEIVCTVIFAPFAIIFYFISFRKKFKQMEEGV